MEMLNDDIIDGHTVNKRLVVGPQLYLFFYAVLQWGMYFIVGGVRPYSTKMASRIYEPDNNHYHTAPSEWGRGGGHTTCTNLTVIADQQQGLNHQ